MTKRNRLLIFCLIVLLFALIGYITLDGSFYDKNMTIPLVTEEEKVKKTEVPRVPNEKISGYANPEALISAEELHEKNFSDPSILIFDTRGRTYRVFQYDYQNSHLPGAIPILYKHYCHPVYNGRMASPIQLQEILGKNGITNNSIIVFYGNDGLQARLYWAVKMYGYDKVKILDGGLDRWKEAGYDVTASNAARPPNTFEFDMSKSKTELLLATLQEVKAAIGNNNYVIVDARTMKENQAGNIPGSVNICCTELFNKDQTFKQAEDLKTLFESKNVTPNKKVIVYSNVGVRSSLVWFALSELLGYENVKNYDASFNEWNATISKPDRT